MFVKTGRIVRNAVDKHFADKNGEVRYGYTVAVNYKDGTTEYLEASTTSEKLAKCLTRGKLIAVAYESTTVKSQTVNGKTYRHEYMNGAKISFVPETRSVSRAAEQPEYKKATTEATDAVEEKAAEVARQAIVKAPAIKSLKQELHDYIEQEERGELGYDDDMPF